MGFYDNVAFVCDDKSGEYYLINKNFEPISDKKYDDASYFTNGTAQVMDDTGIYSINSKEEKTDCNFGVNLHSQIMVQDRMEIY